jgi:hypothetical protein
LTQNNQVIADQNRKGYRDLILSIDCTKPHGRVAFAIVKNAKTKEIPGGDSYRAFIHLKNKYEPRTTPQRVQLEKDLHTKALGKTKTQIHLSRIWNPPVRN